MLKGILAAAQSNSAETITAALEAIRKHLGMEVAYISEFVGDRTVLREVDAPGLEGLIKTGDSFALDDVYCRHILAGRLPELISDAADYPLAQALPITRATPIGAHMSVPIRQSDGEPVGMFCCLSPHANRSLNDRDLKVMRVFADIVGRQIVRRIEAERKRDAECARIERFIAQKEFTFAYQPIWEFAARKVVGFEALCRFTTEPYRSPDKWFGAAFEAGCGVRLEVAVLEKALEALGALPDDVYLSINACPRTILDGGLTRLLEGFALDRVVLEITEHSRVDDYPALIAGLASLRAHGVRLAIDDAGAGYASLQHIIQLRPDIIKLDMSLTRGVDADPARRALAMALIFFAQQTEAVIVAEGVETQNELATLQLLGARRGQGYYLGRPTDLRAAVALLDARETRKSA